MMEGETGEICRYERIISMGGKGSTGMNEITQGEWGGKRAIGALVRPRRTQHLRVSRGRWAGKGNRVGPAGGLTNRGESHLMWGYLQSRTHHVIMGDLLMLLG